MLTTGVAVLVVAILAGGTLVRVWELVGNMAAIVSLAVVLVFVVAAILLGSRFRQNTRTPYW